MTTPVDADKNTQNTGLESLRLAVQQSYSVYGMVDGVGDVFTDETGVDTATSTNETYVGASDYYTSTGSPSDAGTVFHDLSDTSATITANGNIQTHIPTIDSPYADDSSLGMAFVESTTDSVVVTHDSSLNIAALNFKFSFWFKPNAGGTGDEAIFYKSAGSPNREYQLVYDRTNDKIRFFFSPNGTSETTTEGSNSSVITKGAWNYVEIIRNGDDLLYYVGESASGTGTMAGVTVNSSTNDFRLSYDASFGIDGKIADFRLETHASNTFSSSEPTTKPTLGSEVLYISASPASYGNATEEVGLTATVTGNLVDSSPYGDDEPILEGDGAGDFVSFPGVADYDIGELSTAQFSVSAWVKINNNTLNRGIISGYTTTGAWYFEAVGDELAFLWDASGEASVISTTSPIPNNQWGYCVATIDNGTVTLYVDGSSVGTLGSLTGVVDSVVGGTMTVGARTTGGTSPLNGFICDPRIHSEVISPTPPTASPSYSTEEFYLEHGGGPMTLVSNSQTADSAPTTARALVLYDPIDASTLNTDFTLEVSMDGGSTFSTAFTLSKNANYDSNVEIIESNSLSLDSTSGTSMVWQAKTLNDKEIRVHGVYLTWA